VPLKHKRLKAKGLLPIFERILTVNQQDLQAVQCKIGLHRLKQRKKGYWQSLREVKQRKSADDLGKREENLPEP